MMEPCRVRFGERAPRTMQSNGLCPAMPGNPSRAGLTSGAGLTGASCLSESPRFQRRAHNVLPWEASFYQRRAALMAELRTIY